MGGASKYRIKNKKQIKNSGSKYRIKISVQNIGSKTKSGLKNKADQKYRIKNIGIIITGSKISGQISDQNIG
jgi:hypothetical protein